jgi:hypothetical protein
MGFLPFGSSDDGSSEEKVHEYKCDNHSMSGGTAHNMCGRRWGDKVEKIRAYLHRNAALTVRKNHGNQFGLEKLGVGYSIFDYF